MSVGSCQLHGLSLAGFSEATDSMGGLGISGNECIGCLNRGPIMEPLHIDKMLHFCLDVCLPGNYNGSEASYDSICAALKHLSTEIGTSLSDDQLKEKIADMTGVIPIMTEICSNSCVACTGPFSNLQTCLECSAPHYENITQWRKLGTVPCKQGTRP